MAKFSQLRDLYAFFGFTPTATVRGLFGDPYAVLIALRRRRKKRAAACVACRTGPSMTNPFEEYAMSRAAGVASTWSSPSVASSAVTAKP